MVNNIQQANYEQRLASVATLVSSLELFANWSVIDPGGTF